MMAKISRRLARGDPFQRPDATTNNKAPISL